jgi:signal transduction histidine kinase
LNLELISDNHNLVTICREIAKELPDIIWHIAVRTDPSGRSDMGICLWDYQLGMSMPEDVPWGAQHFALVDFRDLDAFRSVYPYAEAGIVLKQVLRTRVRALMVQAAAPNSSRSGDDTLRSDRDEILQCLMQANLRLQQYEAERTNFLGRALHDFHAPLTALTGYCGLLLEEKIGLLSEQQKIIVNRMDHSCRRLARMTRAMFQLSVGRHVALKPALREGNIRECAEQALYEIQNLTQEKDLQLDIDFEPLSTPLFVDSSQIEQVILNLLENACKFSSRYGSIVVRGYSWFSDRRAKNVFCPAEPDRRVRDARTPNVYRVDIVDSGPGIAPEHLKSIFEEYVSYSGGQDRSRGGLGLAICRMILNQHQGRIWAENGQSGAVFSFTLPLQRADGAHHSSEAIRRDTRTEAVAACV